MSSYLIYNGVRLSLMKTNTFSQEVVYSEGETDVLGVKVVLDVEALYAPGAMSYLPEPGPAGFPVAVPSPGEIAPVTNNAISDALLTPRAKLQYVIGGVLVINSPADGYLVDVDAGPKPIHCRVLKLTERSWTVAYRVETMIRDCPATSSGLISSRWKQVEAIGSDRLSTITTRGISVFRSDRLSELDVTADFFRSICLPPHIRNFQRIQQVVQLNEVGNTLHWEVVDRERFVSIGERTAAAYGVVDFSANLNVGTVPAGEGGVASEYCVGTFECVVKGHANSSRRGLLAYAARMAVEKLAIPAPGANPDPGVSPTIIKINANEQIDAPVVGLVVAVKMPPAFVNGGGLGGLNFGLLGYDPGEFRMNASVQESIFWEGAQQGTNPQLPNGTRSNHQGMLLSQKIRTILEKCEGPQHPVCTTRVGGYGPGDENNLPVGPGDYLCGTGYIRVGVGLPLYPIKPNKYSDAQKDGTPYTESKVEVSYHRQTNRVVAPVAGKDSNGNPAPPLVFELANPLDIRTASWTSERMGSKPHIPAPNSLDENDLLIGSEIHGSAPEVAPDGSTPIYRTSGSYTYAQHYNRGPGDGGLAMGRAAYTGFHFNDPGAKIEEADYRHGLTGPPSPTPALPPPPPVDYPPA